MNNPIGVALVLCIGGFLIYRGSKQIMKDSDKEIDIMARTAWGEARGEGAIGMQAVLNVVMNRVRLGGWYGLTPAEVCQKPAQFSVWNRTDPNYTPMLTVTDSDKNFATAKNLASLAYHGALPDITGGATNYLALGSLSMAPIWTSRLTKTAEIGRHTFYA